MTVGEFIAELSNAPDLNAPVAIEINGIRIYESFQIIKKVGQVTLEPFVISEDTNG
jgi:hypothetical protein